MVQIGFNRTSNIQPQKPSKVAFAGGKPSKQTLSYLGNLKAKHVFQVDFAKTPDLFNGIKLFEGIKPRDFFGKNFNFGAILLQMGCIHQCKMCAAEAPQRIKTMPFDHFKKVVDGMGTLTKRLGFNPFKLSNGTIGLYHPSDPMIYGSKNQDGVWNNFYDAAKYLYEKTGAKTFVQSAGWHGGYSQKAAEQFAGDSSMLESFNFSIHPFHSFMENSIQAAMRGDGAEAQKWRNTYTDMMANAIATTSGLTAKLNDKDGDGYGVLLEYISKGTSLGDENRRPYCDYSAVADLYSEITQKAKALGAQFVPVAEPKDYRAISLYGRGASLSGESSIDAIQGRRSPEVYNTVMIAPDGAVLSNPYSVKDVPFKPHPVLNSDGTPMKLNFCGFKRGTVQCSK